MFTLVLRAINNIKLYNTLPRNLTKFQNPPKHYKKYGFLQKVSNAERVFLFYLEHGCHRAVANALRFSREDPLTSYLQSFIAVIPQNWS